MGQKPHVRCFADWLYVCYGFGYVGYGASYTEAYACWKIAVSLGPNNPFTVR